MVSAAGVADQTPVTPKREEKSRIADTSSIRVRIKDRMADRVPLPNAVNRADVKILTPLNR